MPYTDSQKRYYNTKPSIDQLFTTIKISNPVAGTHRLIAADQNGPYKPMMFNDDGTLWEHIPVAASVPPVARQDPLSNDIGNLNIARVALQFSDFLDEIADNAIELSEKIITVTLNVYENPISEPVYTIDVYAGVEGVTIGETDVTVKLQYSNPAKTRYAPFYNPETFVSLKYD